MKGPDEDRVMSAELRHTYLEVLGSRFEPFVLKGNDHCHVLMNL
jgi:hypothetical protein